MHTVKSKTRVPDKKKKMSGILKIAFSVRMQGFQLLIPVNSMKKRRTPQPKANPTHENLR